MIGATRVAETTTQCAPSSLLRGGLSLLPNFQKAEGLDRISIFGGVCWERVCDFFQEGLQFVHKKKTKI